MTPSRAYTWLCDVAMPFWLEHGVDWRKGAFTEDLNPLTLRQDAGFRRLRVAARQIYVFTKGARLGVSRAEDAVELGLGFLRHFARQDDGGHAHKFSCDNQPIDLTRDLYDHAFVLLAYATAGQQQAARDVLTYIDAQLIHPDVGWRESIPDALPRRQNPHMHLLEAVLSAAEAFGDPVYLDRADTIVDLFADRLFQPECGGLPEYFDDALVPHREDGRFIVEPGHHHEWVWLLDEHRRIAAAAGRCTRDTWAQSTELMAFAERYGVDANGIVAGQLWSDGVVKESATRVWPHTERLKALSRSRAEPLEIDSALSALWRFIDGATPGLWREHWNGDFVCCGVSPASTLYHITCSVLEVCPRPSANPHF